MEILVWVIDTEGVTGGRAGRCPIPGHISEKSEAIGVVGLERTGLRHIEGVILNSVPEAVDVIRISESRFILLVYDPGVRIF